MVGKIQYSLSDDDVRFLKNLDRLGHTPLLGSHLTSERAVINPAGQVYIANVTSSIPARSGTTPGTAACDIYEVRWKSSAGTSQDTELISLSSVSENVYNLSASAVAAGYYVVRRERFGYWVIGRFPCAPGTATSSGSQNPPTTCCPQGSPLVGYSVVISGMSGTSCSFTGVYGAGCTINCADLNGTYVMPNVTDSDCSYVYNRTIVMTGCGGPAFPRPIFVSLDIQANGANRDVIVVIYDEFAANTFFYGRNNNITTQCAALAETLTSGTECCVGGTAVVTAIN